MKRRHNWKQWWFFFILNIVAGISLALAWYSLRVNGVWG